MMAPIDQRFAGLDWADLGAQLDDTGFALAGPLLTSGECDSVRTLYDADESFRSRIVMTRHGFGRGEYKYFAYPLPPAIVALREHAYPHLAPIANAWSEALGLGVSYPDTLDDMLQRCHGAGQQRPTPLLLRYGAGDYNCLHQDLYGEHLFPIQLAILLDRPGEDFDGGELILTEQRPRMQSRASVVPLRQGHGVLFAVNIRPRLGTRGHHRVTMRHGVSTVLRGHRHTLGIIFHDAK